MSSIVYPFSTAALWRTCASKLGSITAAAFVAGSPNTYPKFAIEPIRRCSKNIRRPDATAGHEPFRHRRRYWAAYARAQYSCQARALSSHAFRIWSCTFIRCVTASETRKATPRMPAPHAVLKVGEPDRWPAAIAHAVRIALTMTNVTEPAIRRVIQPIAQSVDLSCDKGYGTKITYAKFRPAGAPSTGQLFVRVCLNTVIDRMRFSQHVRVAKWPRPAGHGEHGRGHGENYRAHLGARGRGRRPEPWDEPADLGHEQPPPSESDRRARLPGPRRASRHREG